MAQNTVGEWQQHAHLFLVNKNQNNKSYFTFFFLFGEWSHVTSITNSIKFDVALWEITWLLLYLLV
jgi:hypothetical protein